MSTTRALIRKSHQERRNGWRIIRSQSLFKWLFVGAFACAFELGMGVLFYDGFRFLNAFGGAGTLLVGRLFSLFFLGIGLMLFMSSIVTSYATIFRSDEIRYLMTTPFSVTQIILYKLTEATVLASWAFFFIIIPFIGAYALFEKASLWMPVWTLLFSIPFLFLFSTLGAIAVLFIVRWVPRKRMALRIIPPAIIAVGMLLWAIAPTASWQESPTQFNIAAMVPGLRLAANPFMPSWWQAEGITALTHGHVGRGLMMWALLVSTAGVLVVGFEWLARHLYYDAWQHVLAGSGNTRRKPLLLMRVERLLAGLKHDARAIVMKDIRTFFRDPQQWSQALVFFGLLAIYFANLRSFDYHSLSLAWRSAITFLNIFSVSAVLCSLGSRFVYPQLSLEGHGFWMLGLAPTSMRRILRIKYMAAAIPMLVISVALVALSTSMLNATPAIRAMALSLTVAISLAVCALSTGLGAIFLDLDQRNPAAIVSGFGGTLNLVFSLGFMLIMILPFATLFHLHNIQKLTDQMLRTGMMYCIPLAVAITILTIALPLHLAARSLERRDF